MSIHLVTCASAVRGLPASHKLLLLCFAENARDGSNRSASPGIEESMTWTGLSKSRVLAATRNLEELHLIEQTGRGNRGRRSTFHVFPDGCCQAHGRQEEGSWERDPFGASEGDVEAPFEAPIGSRLQDPIDGDQACGYSRQRHPIDKKGSRLEAHRVSFSADRVPVARPLPLENYPQTASSEEVPATTHQGDGSPSNVISLSHPVKPDDCWTWPLDGRPHLPDCICTTFNTGTHS